MCNSDDSENRVRQLLQGSGLIELGLNLDKVLFLQTVEGKAHMSRQLEPDLYLDGMLRKVYLGRNVFLSILSAPVRSKFVFTMSLRDSRTNVLIITQNKKKKRNYYSLFRRCRAAAATCTASYRCEQGHRSHQSPTFRVSQCRSLSIPWDPARVVRKVVQTSPVY